MLKKAIAIVTTVFLVSSCNMNFVNNTISETQSNISLKVFSIKSTTNPNEVKKSFLSKTRISKGKEDESKKTFKFEVTQADLSRNFVLNIFNGPDGTNRVANIEVKVNGKIIIFKHDEDLNDIEDINKIKNKLCENHEKDDDKKFSTKSEKDDDSVKIKDCSLLLQNFFNKKTESLSARMWGIKAGTNVLEVKVKEDEKKKFALDISIDGFLQPVNIPNAIHSKAAITQSSRTSPTVKGKINIKFLEGMKVRLIKDSTGKRKLVDLNGTSLLALERVFSSFNITKIANPIHLKPEEMDATEIKMEYELNIDVPNGNLFYRVAFDEGISVWEVVDEIKKLPYIEEAFPDFEGSKPNSCEIPNESEIVKPDLQKGKQYSWLEYTHIADTGLFISYPTPTAGQKDVFTPNKKNVNDKTDTIIMNDESKWGAWRYGRGNESIGVAILDSWFEHPGFGSYSDGKPILLHEDFDQSKIEFVSNVDKPDKPISVYNLLHGTAASGIIGAKANNNLGIAGVTDAKMLWVNSYQNAEEKDSSTGIWKIPPKDTSSYIDDIILSDGFDYSSGFDSFMDSLGMLGNSKYDWVKVRVSKLI